MEHFDFIGKHINDANDANFLSQFYEDAKNGVQYEKLVIIHGIEDIDKKSILNYIKSGFYINEYLCLNRFGDSINYNTKNIKLIVVENGSDSFCDIDAHVINNLLEVNKVNLIMFTNTVEKILNNKKMNDKIKYIDETIPTQIPKLERTYKCTRCLIGQNKISFDIFDKKGAPKICKECIDP